MISETKYQKALGLAIQVIQSYIERDDSIPVTAAKPYHELETLYFELTAKTING